MELAHPKCPLEQPIPEKQQSLHWTGGQKRSLKSALMTGQQVCCSQEAREGCRQGRSDLATERRDKSLPWKIKGDSGQMGMRGNDLGPSAQPSMFQQIGPAHFQVLKKADFETDSAFLGRQGKQMMAGSECNETTYCQDESKRIPAPISGISMSASISQFHVAPQSPSLWHAQNLCQGLSSLLPPSLSLAEAPQLPQFCAASTWKQSQARSLQCIFSWMGKIMLSWSLKGSKMD